MKMFIDWKSPNVDPMLPSVFCLPTCFARFVQRRVFAPPTFQDVRSDTTASPSDPHVHTRMSLPRAFGRTTSAKFAPALLARPFHGLVSTIRPSTREETLRWTKFTPCEGLKRRVVRSDRTILRGFRIASARVCFRSTSSRSFPIERRVGSSRTRRRRTAIRRIRGYETGRVRGTSRGVAVGRAWTHVVRRL